MIPNDVVSISKTFAVSAIAEMQHAVHNIITFSDSDQCLEFIRNDDMKVCVVIFGSLGQEFISRIHDMSQVDSVFIFSDNRPRDEQLIKLWTKINGVFRDAPPICRALKKSVQQNNGTKGDLVGIIHSHTEDGILFSMPTLFRINDIKRLTANNRIQEVNLTLINDKDKDLAVLTNYIRQDNTPDKQGWFQLGSILIKMNYFDKAEQFYQFLLDQTKDVTKKAAIYDQLENGERSLSPDDPILQLRKDNLERIKEKM
ncbi:hypothetical protein I4U23_005627 [Adineta vaga]|nr:hypothetical protein I4U23_005627 [Adineta vaga]